MISIEQHLFASYVTSRIWHWLSDDLPEETVVVSSYFKVNNLLSTNIEVPAINKAVSVDFLLDKGIPKEPQHEIDFRIRDAVSKLATFYYENRDNSSTQL